MNECIIACETLKNELSFCMEAANPDRCAIWIESGLHNTPAKLHDRLQKALDNIPSHGRVLLCFGTCGNSVLGLRTGPFELIMPRVDDCITLLLGSASVRERINQEHSAYYLTEGWLRGERNLIVEYNYCVEKYGAEQAKEIAEAIYGHYRTLGLLDTGVGDIASLYDSTKNIADTLGLERMVFPASVDYIRQLLNGPRTPDRFIIKQPFSEIVEDDLIPLKRGS